MYLKEQIARVRAEHAARRAAESAESAAESARNRDKDAAAAAEIVGALPGMIAEALDNGTESVELCTCGDYCELRTLPGVAGRVRDLIAAEGLRGNLWLDRDLSGGFKCSNRLMFRV